MSVIDAFWVCMCIWGFGLWMGVRIPCLSVRNDIDDPASLFFFGVIENRRGRTDKACYRVARPQLTKQTSRRCHDSLIDILMNYYDVSW